MITDAKWSYYLIPCSLIEEFVDGWTRDFFTTQYASSELMMSQVLIIKIHHFMCLDLFVFFVDR